MADTQNLPNINLPQRTITITGTMTARLFQAAIRASRIDLRSMQVAMAPPHVRDPSNRAVDRLMAAVARFEEEMTLAEKDLESASNNNSNRRSNAQSAAKPRQGRDARPQSTGANGQPTATKLPTANGQFPAAGASTNPRSRNRNKAKGNGGATAAQATSAAQQGSQQNPESAAKPALNPTQPKAAPEGVKIETPAPTPAPVQAEQMAPAPQADVAATIQAL